MKKNLAYWGVCAFIYVLYFQIIKFIWNRFVPWNILTDLIALFVLIVVNIPFAVITTEKVIKIIKKIRNDYL